MHGETAAYIFPYHRVINFKKKKNIYVHICEKTFDFNGEEYCKIEKLVFLTDRGESGRRSRLDRESDTRRTFLSS